MNERFIESEPSIPAEEMQADVRETVPLHRHPIGIGLLGLALIIGGWKLMTFVPSSPQEQASAERLAEIRGMAQEGALQDRLDRLATNVRREPPLRLPGRLIVLAGLTLFVMAGVRMYRTPGRPGDSSAHQ